MLVFCMSYFVVWFWYNFDLGKLYICVYFSLRCFRFQARMEKEQGLRKHGSSGLDDSILQKSP